MGFTLQEYKECLYYDEHERADVVIYHCKYLDELNKIALRKKYTRDLLDQVLCPVIEEGKKEHFCVFQEKYTIHTKKQTHKAWMAKGDWYLFNLMAKLFSSILAHSVMCGITVTSWLFKSILGPSQYSYTYIQIDKPC